MQSCALWETVLFRLRYLHFGSDAVPDVDCLVLLVAAEAVLVLGLGAAQELNRCEKEETSF